MQPLLYSEAAAERDENGWKRVGYNISYHKTSIGHSKALAQENLDLYTLTWTMVGIIISDCTWICSNTFHIVPGISLF